MALSTTEGDAVSCATFACAVSKHGAEDATVEAALAAPFEAIDAREVDHEQLDRL